MTGFLSSGLLARSSLMRAVHRPQQIRMNWQVFCEKVKNPKTGKTEHLVDPQRWMVGSGLRFVNPEAGYLLEYEKPWMRRKRIKIQKVWKKREQTVKDLVSYIKVKRQLADELKK
mmetsp:Transcript_74/g.126  ORF Transcript_74/g.126 Transcript_74/m.126 type:complete len:115 (-) Transcript_74:89-433(-)|eukprot:CAMPEP_0119002864 /NCGR_PEP_ID=MMETSP1176-20130426/193_1 /TAXON_ID=265551 /ORGANISM="Synedropsis recta cf, Strain CCMP1620" /LENGTH=114 /DNA_ID=CAMNT_0006954397 /DNA_START=44 /DNA_END=388 /DNA_ORIENTATION=+